ncbi:retinoschisin-like [Asterias rubens]|uniref:retinoschisin-like n=1 Tax=Asterias rubens TaxID=7604 RepID=UPI00145517E0|nr:retinoschisin-like [Asterias rubens]XP_033639624.1 retinoschisin-like [Asterias rubens]
MTLLLRALNLVPILLLAFGLPCIQSKALFDFAKAYGDVCGLPLSSEVKDGSITASSSMVGYQPEQVRFQKLNYVGWRPALSNRLQWLQVELPRTIYVTGILTQGNTQIDNYVTQYKIEYSLDLKHWACLMDMHGYPKIFTGNSDHTSTHLNKFRPAVLARYIRFVPVEWVNKIGLKMEIFGGGCAECWEK